MQTQTENRLYIRYRPAGRNTGVDIFLYVAMGLLAFLMAFPFYSVMVLSVSPYVSSLDLLGRVIPKNISWDAYLYVVSSTNLMTGLRNTVLVVLMGVPYNMLLTTMMAYALSKRWLFGRSVIMNLVIFTMFFSGGLIPFYLLVTSQLHLRDSLAAIILPYGINTFNMVIIKNYFQSLPQEIEESAFIDGANDIRIFFSIVIQISLPVLATFTLFYTVDRWNEWFNSMLFLTKNDLFTLQLALRELVIKNERLTTELAVKSMMQKNISAALKCAATVITIVPIMLAYPFLQKYFVKGLLLGAIKS